MCAVMPRFWSAGRLESLMKPTVTSLPNVVATCLKWLATYHPPITTTRTTSRKKPRQPSSRYRRRLSLGGVGGALLGGDCVIGKPLREGRHRDGNRGDAHYTRESFGGKMPCR